MTHNLGRFLFSCLLVFASSNFLVSCSAQPQDSDLKRVKQQFLQLRFQAATLTEYKNKTDLELFELSCQNNRVKCEPVLELLKKEDPQFYDTLTNKASTENNH